MNYRQIMKKGEMDKMKLGYKKQLKVLLAEGVKMPCYAHDGDAGLDLRARGSALILPHDRMAFRTGVMVEIPEGHFGSIRSRSGMMRNHGIITDGVIDCNYRGEIGVTLINTSSKPYKVEDGDKIAQLIIQPYESVEVVQVNELAENADRGVNGFGSSGR